MELVRVRVHVINHDLGDRNQPRRLATRFARKLICYDALPLHTGQDVKPAFNESPTRRARIGDLARGRRYDLLSSAEHRH